MKRLQTWWKLRKKVARAEASFLATNGEVPLRSVSRYLPIMTTSNSAAFSGVRDELLDVSGNVRQNRGSV